MFSRVQIINTAIFSRAFSSNVPKSNKSFAFYDLVCRTPTHPREPIEALLMTNRDLKKLKKIQGRHLKVIMRLTSQNRQRRE